MAGDLEDLAANDPSPGGLRRAPAEGAATVQGAGAHGGGPVLVTSHPGSNMILSGPAIVQQPAPAFAAWRPDMPCPACGQKLPAGKKDAKPGWKLPEAWNVPPGIGNELRRLQDLAYTGDAPAITLGGCRSMLQVLFAQLPHDITHPKAAEPKGWVQRLFGPAPEKPGKSAKAVLKRAREHGEITQAVLDAGLRLPLEPEESEKASTSTAKQFVAFLVELADALYAQPARLA